MRICKAIYRQFFTALLLFLLSHLSAHAHEMRPAIADITVSPTQVSVTIRFNAELFLADIDASEITDSDDAPNATTYDRMRQLPPAENDATILQSLDPAPNGRCICRAINRPKQPLYRSFKWGQS